MTLQLHSALGANGTGDNELKLLTDYLGGFMTEDDRTAFEQRLVDDIDFFGRVGPMLEAWYTAQPTPVEIQAAQEIRGIRARRRRMHFHKLIALASGMAAAAAAALVFVAVPRDAHKPGLPGTVATTPKPSGASPSSPHSPTASTADSAHRVVAITPAPPIHRPRVSARRPTPREPQIVDRAIEEALITSITRPLPELRSAAVGAVPAPDLQATPITAVEVPSQLPDSTAQNAAERARDLAAPKVPGAQGIVARSWWQKIKDKIRRHPPVHSRF